MLPPPGSAAPEEPTLDLVRRARELGVDRVVLLSASAITAKDPGLGRVHAALAAGPTVWTVLRPTWFSQNLLDPSHHLGAAVARGEELVTATGAARVAFVDAGDIAAVAARALLDPHPHDTDHVITGPEALSYDDVAAVLSAATGREIRHRSATVEVAARSMVDAGIPRDDAELLAGLETAVAGGSEDRVTTTVRDVTGRSPRRFADVVADAMDRGGRHRRVLRRSPVFRDWSFSALEARRVADAPEWALEMHGDATWVATGAPYAQDDVVRFAIGPSGRLTWMREFWDPTRVG